ncbi:OmpA family protein [Pseudodesulfovibrio sediminis]|uniref:OmpA-like domain-containing protein n=1 Tax=Pseudodesulfovibrio sediminis TaxID=2810563 RepID=A0ABN6EYN5_9BACT|nr:OmpA family protein [Pseudodesulfovibrio sediminis]BCS90295.1 hypothetical protein PSDVSF_35370 [Pseudodesulfovibrio sediminis]
MKKALIFALLLILPACAYVDPSLTDQTVVYSNSPVRKSPLQVSVHPKGKQYTPLTAYFHPFVIQQRTPDHAALSNSFGQIFFNVWTEERLFPTMEFGTNDRYQGLETAMDTARRRGADVLILGKVPYFYAGHTLDDTAITIQLDIYSTGSGQLIWTMMQSGRIEDKMPDDYIYFRHEYRLSESGFNKIIRAIAKDMTIPVAAWLPSPFAHFKTVETEAEIKSELAGDSTSSMNAPRNAAMNSERDLPPEQTLGTNARGVNLDVLFDFDKATIQEQSYPLLDSLGQALNSDELKGKSIVIGGHTDTKGNDEYNLALSKRRAEAVKAYLVSKWSVNPAHVKTMGYGRTRPLNKGLTDEEQRKNRRVEIRLAE